MTIRYSEIFFSFQGEAELAGVPAVWLRFFGCNLNCNGFGQANPTDPSTYILPYKDADLSNVQTLKDLPVWKYGCDSSYSWSAKYKHLAQTCTVDVVVDRLVDANRSEHNPEGKFIHPKTHQPIMLCFTGGEPMLQQPNIIAILQELRRRGNLPTIVTVETNATVPLSEALREFINTEFFARVSGGERWHWAMSPKLFNVSGEANAIKPDIIYSYAVTTRNTSVLKFVCRGGKADWDELDGSIEKILQKFDILKIPPIWIMPVGATQEAQSDIADLCMEAMHRGYNVATRNQCAVFGNKIGF